MKRFDYTVSTQVRITDINYGMHLSNIALDGMFHNARVLFLKENSFNTDFHKPYKPKNLSLHKKCTNVIY